MYPTRIRVSRLSASTGLPKSRASPSVAGRRPVSIFMVVDFPQPLEPRKPKISPRSIVKFTALTAVNFPKRRVRFFATMAGSPPVSTRGGMVRRRGPPRFSSGRRATKVSSRSRLPVRLLELLGRAGREDAAGVHRHQPVEALGLVHVRRGDEHAHPRPPGPDLVDERPELLAGEGVDAGRGLVEDEQVRVVDQGGAEADLLLHAAGELARRPVRERVEPGRLQERADPGAALGRRRARTAARRSRCSRRRSARGRGSCRGPGACRRCAGRRRCDAGRRRCPRPARGPRPVWIFFAPAMIPIMVDLPTPSGPISPTMHPDGISIVTSSRARVLPYRCVRPVTVATGGIGPGIGAPGVRAWGKVDRGRRATRPRRRAGCSRRPGRPS